MLSQNYTKKVAPQATDCWNKEKVRQLVQCCLYLYLLCSLFLALINVTLRFCVKNSNSAKKERALVGKRRSAGTSVYTLVMCISHQRSQICYQTCCVVLTQLITSVGNFKRLITFFVYRNTLKSMNASNVMFVCCILLACLCYTYINTQLR